MLRLAVPRYRIEAWFCFGAGEIGTRGFPGAVVGLKFSPSVIGGKSIFLVGCEVLADFTWPLGRATEAGSPELVELVVTGLISWPLVVRAGLSTGD